MNYYFSYIYMLSIWKFLGTPFDTIDDRGSKWRKLKKKTVDKLGQVKITLHVQLEMGTVGEGYLSTDYEWSVMTL